MTNAHLALNRYVIPDMPSADELLPCLREIDAKRWYSNNGPLVSRFERMLGAHLSAQKSNPGGKISVMSAASCYHALQIGMMLFKLPQDARVLVPAVTFPACPLAVQQAGARAVLADIDAGSWQLTPQTARRIAAKVEIHAVMPVALYGVPVDADAWDAFTEETGIPVIIDAAAALEAQPIPRHGLVAFSLHATKPFSIGEGGLLVGRNVDQIEDAFVIANFGTQRRIATGHGVNAKLSEYHGAVALAQLDRWEGIKQRRRKAFDLYSKHIEASGLELSFQPGIENAITSALMLKSETDNAADITKALNAQGIAAHRMYLPPLYHHPHFANLISVGEDGTALLGSASLEQKMALMKNSEDIHGSVFGVPCHAFVEEADIAYMIDALEELTEMPRAKTA